MPTDVLDRLPSRAEVSREIYQTARRSRRLRALYRLLGRIESEQTAAADSGTTDQAEVSTDG